MYLFRDCDFCSNPASYYFKEYNKAVCMYHCLVQEGDTMKTISTDVIMTEPSKEDLIRTKDELIEILEARILRLENEVARLKYLLKGAE